ncbi:MAG: division/cell wall cluster transcriptional repressor MraZ [Clostridia bacterium]|nr:division/cell wall cluster transcriptional repressor MraZ [Clostridia bacterium]
MLFKSAYYHSLDAKNRVFIPAKFRDALGEEFVVFKGSEKCLYVYTKEGFEKVSRQFMNTNNREIQRAFFSQVVDMTADKQGRITLSNDLLEHADITKDVSIIGAGSRIEIWATENYKVDVKPLSELINFDDFTF